MGIKDYNVRRQVNNRFKKAFNNYGYLSLYSIVNSCLHQARSENCQFSPKQLSRLELFEESISNKITLLPQQVNIKNYAKKNQLY